MPEKKITIEEVNGLDQEEFVERFGSLYEHSPWVAEGAWKERPFRNISDLHGAFQNVVRAAPPERRLALIRAHPDLAGKAATEGALTQESTREHASAGLDRLTPEEYEAFHRLNDAYKEKFGFPLIFAAREHTKGSILSGAEARLKHPRSEEVETALSEIAKIAHFRLQELVERDPTGKGAEGAEEGK
jgi:2-oxo-4-hydroxy-4-carboxy-5-ureidoimidazoline decarboxylase